ncbi:flavodoxin domain-containing protein [Agriterribacter sp.]|uniref:diflavin oxidoreductase n=1 Tax=Agriterribacter sp. TaxID=2821509 RepID=UPI002D187A88|nr:flavodoxin domain-containing protein [Agriterribacter sp.]HRO45596.1 flavodoxin domain-containing protein [Agriterribacter sp.]HRQ18679.1 flavodoxin domain-containing protein [Agriterribacter sp.]
MLAEHRLKAFQDLITQSSREELIWMNGFIAGLVASEANGTGAPEKINTAPRVNKISILFGTETGNSKKVATEFATQAKKSGINVKLSAIDQYRINDLAKEEYVLLVISTQGDGEPPVTAKKFYDHIHQQPLALDKMKFSVLALGDSSYPLFCKAGEDVDCQLTKLGAKRIVPLQKCDTEYAEEAAVWFSQVMKALSEGSSSNTASVPAKKPKGKKNYTGVILTNLNLNDRGSNKQTHHIEIAVDEDIQYEPGDSIGLIPHNRKELVENIIALTGVDPDATIEFRKERHTIAEALTRKINIIHLPERVVKQYASVIQQEIPDTRIDLLDLLRIYPVKDATQFEQVIPILEPIAPRLYSVSSSPEAHSGEVHITVARDKFSINGEIKYGLCSDFLSQLEPDSTIDFYVHKNAQFKLPAANKDVIMIGPGTGIAPFRSFLAERDATGADGRNWLFFGDQCFVTDFLYQTEIQNWADTGVLTNVHLAFSRDQQSKIYVQHRMLEHAAELWQWITGGAYVYVCGTRAPMSTDVENALIQIAQHYGGKSVTEAVSFVENLKEEGRYLLDVY